jgi:hypothetical protein
MTVGRATKCSALTLAAVTAGAGPLQAQHGEGGQGGTRVEALEQSGTGGETKADRGAPAREPTGAELDARIASAVRELLMNDPDVQVEDLRVEVQDGIVTLYGRAGRVPDRTLAGSHVDAVRGVQGVVNLIEIVPGVQRGVEIIPGRASGSE